MQTCTEREEDELLLLDESISTDQNVSTKVSKVF